MAEPTSAYTFQDLIVRVAEAVGVASYGSGGTGAAAIPTDPHDLDLIKRTVNDGIKMFVANAPSTGWKWKRQLLSQTFDSTGGGADNINSDASRYLLPNTFRGQVDGPIRYAALTNKGSTIEWVGEATIRRLRETTISTGTPRIAAIVPASTERRFELIVYPAPQSNFTVEFPFTIFFDKLTGLTDLPPAGVRFDDVTLSACKAKAEMDITEFTPDISYVTKYHEVDLPSAYRIDARLAPRTLGSMNRPPTTRRVSRVWENVDNANSL